MEDLLTTREVSEMIDRTPGRVVQLIRAGELAAELKGGIYLIKRKDAENLVLKKPTGRPPNEQVSVQN